MSIRAPISPAVAAVLEEDDFTLGYIVSELLDRVDEHNRVGYYDELYGQMLALAKIIHDMRSTGPVGAVEDEPEGASLERVKAAVAADPVPPRLRSFRCLPGGGQGGESASDDGGPLGVA